MENTLQTLMRQAALSLLDPLEARMLMQHATGFSRTSLISRSLDVLPDTAIEQFNALVERRKNGEPMAYIIGVREFYGRDFAVNVDVLIPRPDTETLIDHLLNDCGLSEKAPLNVLDLGTGSGAIAVTLASERRVWRVSAVDISPAALKTAQQNAAALGADVLFFESDWLAALPVDARFDVIVSNPPYVANDDVHLSQGDVRFEPRGALTDFGDGLSHYRFLVEAVKPFLKTSGQLWFEHGYDQGSALRQLLEDGGFVQVNTVVDLGGNERVTGGVLMHTTLN